jgi:hypothetical protein
MSIVMRTVRGLGVCLGAVALASCGAEGGVGDGDLPAFRPSVSATRTTGDIGGAGGGTGQGQAVSPGPATPSIPWTPAPSTPVDRYLRTVSLTTADVTDLGLVVQGDSASNSLQTPTIALCQKSNHPSEKRRVARWGVNLVPAGESGVGEATTTFTLGYPDMASAVTAYDSPAAAEQAMAEWRRIIARDECDLDGQQTVAGLRIGRSSERTDGSLPLADNSVVTTLVHEKDRRVVTRGYTILQRHEDLVAEVIYPLGNAHDLDDVKRLATTLGRRLAETPR